MADDQVTKCDAASVSGIDAMEASLRSTTLHGKLPVREDEDEEVVGGNVDGAGLIEPARAKVPVNVKATQINMSFEKMHIPPVDRFDQLPLHENLLRGISEQNWANPSPIQSRALPYLLLKDAQNMIAQAPAGTGKTAAFVLSMLSKVDDTVACPQALVICPTRELANQNAEVTQKLAKFTNIQTQLVLKDVELASLNAQVLVGTPGSFLVAIKKRKFDVKAIRVVVIDEADEMIKMQETGRRGESLGAQVSKVMSHVQRYSPHIMLFSATFPEEVRDYAQKVASPDPMLLTVRTKQLLQNDVEHFLLECGTPEKRFDALSACFGIMEIGQTIIFVNTKHQAESLSQRLLSTGHSVSMLHGGLEPTMRDQIMKSFKSHESTVLVATDVIHRGIDAAAVTCVVNYDIPILKNEPNYESYYHRSGRAGRYFGKGAVLNFAGSPRDTDVLGAILQKFDRQYVKLDTTSPEALDTSVRPYVSKISSD